MAGSGDTNLCVFLTAGVTHNRNAIVLSPMVLWAIPFEHFVIINFAGNC